MCSHAALVSSVKCTLLQPLLAFYSFSSSYTSPSPFTPHLSRNTHKYIHVGMPWLARTFIYLFFPSECCICFHHQTVAAHFVFVFMEALYTIKDLWQFKFKRLTETALGAERYRRQTHTKKVTPGIPMSLLCTATLWSCSKPDDSQPCH